HIKPLFPFGFGLSYTRFQLSRMQIDDSGTSPVVRVDVRNTGSRAGAEVVQAYVGFPTAANEPPLQLKGFAKVTLRPGETTTVRIPLDARALSIWSSGRHGWVTIPGCYRIRVGNSS